MNNERFRYRRGEFKSYDVKPDCPECGTSGHKIQQTPTRDVPFKDNHGGTLAAYTKFVYMCCNCGHPIGYAENAVMPGDIIAAHERPDLSAKYEGNIKHV